MANRTLEEIIASMVAFINAYNIANDKNIDIRQGTVIKDIVVDSPSQELFTLYSDIAYSGKMASLNHASELTEEDLDALGDNVSTPRKGATKALGFADFITNRTSTNPPTENITINSGTQIRIPATALQPEVSFITTAVGQILIANLSNYAFTDVDGVIRYKVTIPVIAVTAGSDGNAASHTLTQLTSSVSGILKVRNTDPLTGGTDLESNEDYAIRLREKYSGTNVGTTSGIKSLILEDERITNVAVVLPGDPEMERDQFGGSVDVYLLGEDIQTSVDNVSFTTGTTGTTINLVKLPAISIVSVDGTVSGSPYSFIIDDEVEFVKDITTLRDSTSEVSQIKFLTGVVPDDNTTVSVTTTYDKAVVDIQALMDLDENHIVASDILIRKSYKTFVDMDMTVSVFSGYIPLDVATAINTALVNSINSYNLNDNLNVSDIVALVDGTDGVNSVELTTPTTTTRPGKTGYLRVGQTTIRIGSDVFIF